MENKKEYMAISRATAEHNARTLYGKFQTEWKRITCLFDNGLATDNEVYEVYHKYKEMAELFHCYEEYRDLLAENNIIREARW